MENFGILLVALLVGVALGAAGVWLVVRNAPRPDPAALERLRASEAQARSDAERARAEAHQAREDLANAHTDVARGQVRVQEAASETARARQQAAEARAEASGALASAADARAEVAGLRAQVVAAAAERDTALARAREIAADRDALVKEFKVLSGAALDEQGKKADHSAELRLRATEQLMAPIRESLAQFNDRLGEVEKARVAMATELREQVSSVRLTGDELRRETASLSRALRKPHVRGAWGEMQLKRVAEVSGMLQHCDFTLQETSQTSEDRTIRPDMKVSLSEGKFVYVDSKVPLTSFLDAHETSDGAEQQRLLGLFAKNVRGHVDQLSGKNYFKADAGSPEFVVLFLPSEALAAEALDQLPDLHEYAAGKGIVLATPTTLIAMLRAVAYSWKQAGLADSAAEVFQLGRELYDRLATLGGRVDKLGRALGSAVNAYNDSLGSLEGRVMVTARRFRDLKVAEGELRALSPVETPLRQVSASELVEDAHSVPPMVGRTPRSELPEASELWRGQPALDDLTGEEGRRGERDRGTMAG